MESLIVKGTFHGKNGHDRHTREFTREMVKQGVSVRLLDFEEFSHIKLPAWQQESFYSRLSKADEAKTILHFTMPHQVERSPRLHNVNFTMFEATRVPAKWIEHNREHDLLILPTRVCEHAWLDSGYPAERIRLCPLGVDLESFHPDVTPLELRDERGIPIREYKMRVLNISHISPRKNLLALLRVWIEATSKSDDMILILKWDCPWKRWLSKFFLDVWLMERRLGKTRKDCAPILWLINRDFSDGQLPGLYAAATHYWSMSHGEGWDLCMMEAGAAGLYLIAPEHSSYTTYLDPSVADLIPSRRVPARFFWAYGMHKMFEGAEWWLPDEKTAAAHLRRALSQWQGERNELARQRFLTEFSWNRATSRLLEILEDLA
jgi:glycosyltransferase involved in cell wall biosynthesis